MDNNYDKGILYLVATPIGNLDDITLRALNTLKSVDLVAAEDTRRTRKLLSFYDIHIPVVSFREHNKVYQGQKLVEKLHEGKNIALCSDAGMPVISDPGESFVRLCIDEQIKVTAIPGPNAALTALIISGLDANTFLYLGFIPRKKKKCIQFLEGIADYPHTLIFYESPNRVANLLECVLEVMGNRKVCVVRELTKIYEEAIRGDIEEVLKKIKDKEPRGEFTIVVEGAPTEVKDTPDYLDVHEVVAEVNQLTSEGMTRQSAFKRVANKYHTSKRAVYQIYLDYGKPDDRE